MGSPPQPQPPTPSSFSSFGPIVTLLAAAPPGRDGSTADSFPFDDNRDEKQKEGILEIIKISDVVSEKAARHDKTCLAQVADEEEGSADNLVTLAGQIRDFLSVLKERAQEGRSEHNHLDLILDSGAGMHATGNSGLLSEFTRAPGGSSAAVYNLKLIPKHIKENLAAAFTKERDEKQKEGIPEIIKTSDVVSEKAAQHDETCLAQVADEEEGSAHNLRTLARPFQDFLSVLKGGAQEGRSEHNHLDIILDSGASMHVTGNLGLLSEFTCAPGSSSAAVYRTRDGKDLRIAGAGKIACDKFHLPHVHYVPELGSRFTLASVQLLAGCDYLVMFCGGWCYVKNRNNGSLVGRGRMHDEDGLYHLEYLRIPLFVVDGAN